ncbi:MFS transporter [Neorhizobium sp. NCHU2750]|uniref:MFS transporter n=1 Tax=Neorhizobium sp. NCHU2750 TaxID=1825976 RepID=UPI000EB62749|nr:MFS transporter [Neorhizobium sp. NCHU2750]
MPHSMPQPMPEHAPIAAAVRPVPEEFEPNWITGDSARFRRASWALFLAGFASFSLIYCVQPLLPEFPADFGVNAATAALALSLTTGALSFAILLSGAFAQMFSRKSLMFTSMMAAALCNLVAASSGSWGWLLAARAVEGFVLGGVPAVAMAYLAEEIEPSSLGRAMGLYVGGTAFGAMVGRVGMGLTSAYTSWHFAMYALGAACVAAAIGFFVLLPPSQNFRPQSVPLGRHIHIWRQHLSNPVLLRLYAIGTMLTSVFTTVFNYSTFRLAGEPYHLNPTAISMIFLTYALGIVASSKGGKLVDRFGRRAMLIATFVIILVGMAMTLITSIVLMVLGICLITIGFFIGHSAASSGVGASSGAAKSHASALYLLFYYIGASFTGWAGGWFWIHGGWGAVAGLTSACAVVGLIVGLSYERGVAGAK